MTAPTLPADARERERYPLAEGLLYYFPAALAAVAEVSRVGNEQHNPGERMHHARGKSTDHANKIMRHLVDAGLQDTDGTLHTAKLAWRSLAMLQEELEARGAPLARNARLPAAGVANSATSVSKPATGGLCAPSGCLPIGNESAHPMMAETLRDTRLHGPEPRL